MLAREEGRAVPSAALNPPIFRLFTGSLPMRPLPPLRLACVSLRGMLLAVLLVGTASSALAQSSRLAGFDLLRLTPSAHGAALAGAYAPAAAAPDGLFYNPAFLSPEADRHGAAGYLNHLADVRLGFAAYARRVDRIEGTVGVAVRHLGYGHFDRTTREGTTEGAFGASETVFTVAYARALNERVRLGANLHTAFVALDDASASALAADVGAAYVLEEHGLVLSAAVRHAGLVLNSLGESEDRIVPDLRVAVSNRLQHVPIRLTLVAHDLAGIDANDGDAMEVAARHLAASGELMLGTALALRFGYDGRTATGLGTGQRLDLAGLGLGFGLNLRRVGFDYAYSAWGAFGGLQHLTVRARL